MSKTRGILRPVGLTLVALAAIAAVAGCDDGGGEEASKADHEAGVAALVAPIGMISAFKPHVKIERVKGDKYEPKERNDLEQGAFYAANEIRHAANGAKQKARRSKSPIVQALVEPFAAVTAACAELNDDEKLPGCLSAIDKLNVALKAAGEAATKAEVSAKVPLVGPDSVGDDAKKDVAMLIRALGPGPSEKAYLKQRGNKDTEPGAAVEACAAASTEAEGVMRELQKVEREIGKVAAHHKNTLDAQCAKLTRAGKSMIGLEECKKDDKNPDCPHYCALAATLMKSGIPAASFEKVPELSKEVCDELKKKKK